jgi:hypothetical protein
MLRITILFLLSTVLLSSCVISRRSNMRFVKNNQIDKEAEVFSISSPLLFARPFIQNALLEDGDEDDMALGKMLGKVRGIRLLTIENNKDYSKINQQLHHYLNRKNYEEWISVHADGSHVQINAKMRKNNIKKLLLTVNSEDGDGVFLRVKGKFSIDDITETVGTLTDSQLKLKTKNNDTAEK